MPDGPTLSARFYWRRENAAEFDPPAAANSERQWYDLGSMSNGGQLCKKLFR